MIEGYLLCAFAGIVAALGFFWFACHVPRERRHAAEVDALKRHHAERLARVASEQMRVRRWNPISRTAPTIRP